MVADDGQPAVPEPGEVPAGRAGRPGLVDADQELVGRAPLVAHHGQSAGLDRRQ
jgi:hypothetical protein